MSTTALVELADVNINSPMENIKIGLISPPQSFQVTFIAENGNEEPPLEETSGKRDKEICVESVPPFPSPSEPHSPSSIERHCGHHNSDSASLQDGGLVESPQEHLRRPRYSRHQERGARRTTSNFWESYLSNQTLEALPTSTTPQNQQNDEQEIVPNSPNSNELFHSPTYSQLSFSHSSASLPTPEQSSYTPGSLSTVREIYPHPLNSREAFLLHNFVHKLAPWADACDLACHFGTEVPRRALHTPMILYAIMACSSRHQALLLETDQIESSLYHSRCLNLLIPALSEDSYDENLLATVVVLRLYEELDSREDTKCHLLGTTRLLNSIAKFSSSGGLGEAASWLSLRQAMYASLVQKEPMNINLENYEHSAAFYESDDASCANVIVFLVAKILSLALRSVDGIDPEVWSQLEKEIEAWNETRPPSFQPICHQEADISQGRPFPEIWLMTSAQVVGLQHYHAAKIILTLYKPPLGPLGFEASRSRRNAE
ncbi:MAG: hypothetical protein M1834_007433 [Cirrosporium novae-zelandiae]|nr:MAG: hypothetical protein M1834_007433 [Cirrosporium novae-zelandiae]